MWDIRYTNPASILNALDLIAGLRIRIHFIRIRIQHLRMNTNPDPDPIRIQGFNDQKLKKKIIAENFFVFFFWSKTAIYLSLGLHKVCPSYRRSHPTLQNMNFYKFFSTFVGHFCHLGSGSGFRIRIRIHRPDWIRIQSGSGSATLHKASVLFSNNLNEYR